MNNIFTVLKKHSFRIYLFIMILIVLTFVNKIPYVNIFVSPFIILTFIYIIAVVIFKLSIKVNIITSVLFIVISIPWLLIGSRVTVENLGILSFIAIFIASMKKAKELRNKK